MSIHAEIYALCAILLCFLSFWKGTCRQAGISFLILLAWCVNVPLHNYLIGQQAGVEFLIVEDILLGAFIIWAAKFASESNRTWQRWIGGLFVLMLANHVVFVGNKLFVTDEWVLYYFEYGWWIGKTVFAWMQLLIFFMWIGRDYVRHMVLDNNRRGNLDSHWNIRRDIPSSPTFHSKRQK